MVSHNVRMCKLLMIIFPEISDNFIIVVAIFRAKISASSRSIFGLKPQPFFGHLLYVKNASHALHNKDMMIIITPS